MTNGISIICATGLSISDGIISSTGLGIIFGGPLLEVSSLFSISSLISLKYDKKVISEIVKFEKLDSLCHAKLNNIQDKISKELFDGKISDEEFNLISEDRNYELQKSELLKKEQN